MPWPTPSGVPVEMTSPGESVTKLEMNSMMAATGKTISAVEASCSTVSLTVSFILSVCGSASSSAGRIAGPIGQNVSCHLPCNQSKNPSLGRSFRSGLG